MKPLREIAVPRGRLNRIDAAVAGLIGVPVAVLRQKTQEAPAVAARHCAMYLARRLTALSLPAIGRLYGRHHTSVLHAISSVKRRLPHDQDLQALVELVEEMFEVKR